MFAVLVIATVPDDALRQANGFFSGAARWILALLGAVIGLVLANVVEG
jgi:hypothetical protein